MLVCTPGLFGAAMVEWLSSSGGWSRKYYALPRDASKEVGISHRRVSIGIDVIEHHVDGLRWTHQPLDLLFKTEFTMR